MEKRPANIYANGGLYYWFIYSDLARLSLSLINDPAVFLYTLAVFDG